MFVFPGTDVNKFNEHVENTKQHHLASLKGVVSMTNESLLQNEDDFDEYSFEMMANIIIDSPNLELVDTAAKLFKKHIENEHMNTSLLLHAISTLLFLPDIESTIDRKSKLLPDYAFFGEKVLSQIRTEIAVPYFIRNVLSSKEDALLLLRFSAKKNDYIASLSADAVMYNFPTALFEVSQLNQIYLKKSIERLQTMNSDELCSMFNYVLEFAQSANLYFIPCTLR